MRNDFSGCRASRLLIRYRARPAGKHVLAAVSTFDSDAKKEGNDLMFMVCSEAWGRQLQAAVAGDLAGRGVSRATIAWN
jgi:hypothetical protein